MRLDKFLKTSLIYKTRSSAEKAITRGHVILNDKISKPSSNVKVGDYLTISFPLKKIKYQILMLSEKNVSRKEARDMYDILGVERFEL